MTMSGESLSKKVPCKVQKVKPGGLFVPVNDGSSEGKHRRDHLGEHLSMMRFVGRKPFDG